VSVAFHLIASFFCLFFRFMSEGLAKGIEFLKRGQFDRVWSGVHIRIYRLAWELLYLLVKPMRRSGRPVPLGKLEVQTKYPVAFESPDHKIPHGTAKNNSTNKKFVLHMDEKLHGEFGTQTLRVMDLGCSGGQMVIDFLELRWVAIGIEGSDHSLKHKRANWKDYANKNLFTADITKPFSVKLCIASAADQAVPLEHIVQDAGSDDGTLDWLLSDPRITAFMEKDEGMYDAINRGLRRTRGDVLAWLNCDEQYLPGALQTVLGFFEQHPDIDVLFGDVVMVDANGQYLFHRKMQVPLKYHTWTSHLSTLSCAMFFRRRVVFDYGCFFDPRWRDVGDGEWMLRLLKRGVKMATLGRFTSVFTQTGANMSAGPNALREARELFLTAPFWARQLKPLFVQHHRLRRFLGGMYRQTPFTYEIFNQASPERRQPHHASRPAPFYNKTNAGGDAIRGPIKRP